MTAAETIKSKLHLYDLYNQLYSKSTSPQQIVQVECGLEYFYVGIRPLSRIERGLRIVATTGVYTI